MRKTRLQVGVQRRIDRDDPYYRLISDGWSNALKSAFASLPSYTG